MIYPTLTPENVTRDFIDVFGGYNHNARISDNEFYDMENMSSSNYPLLSTRRRRGKPKDDWVDTLRARIRGMLYAADLFYAVALDGDNETDYIGVYKNAEPLCFIPSTDITTRRSLIMSGAYLIILPDKYYINTVDSTDQGFIENTKTTSGDITLQGCDADGNPIELDSVGDTAPDGPNDGFLWLDTSVDPPILKTYYSSSEMWVANDKKYFKITAGSTIGSGFSEGDGVKITGVEEIPEDSYPVIHIINSDNKKIVFKGKHDIGSNLSFLTAYESYTTTGAINVISDEEFEENQFKDIQFTIGAKRVKCNSSSNSVEIEETVIDTEHNLTNRSNSVVVKSVRTGTTYRIYVDLEDDESFLDTTNTLHVRIGEGKKGKVYEVKAVNRDTTLGVSPYLAVQGNERVAANSGDVIYPVTNSGTEMYKTTLSFEETVSYVKQGQPIYFSLAYIKTISTAITISRTMPELDYVIESKNRLWGCRYGLQGDKFVNEIYCSKLGDFKNWNCFEGISTDSYVASCGSDGKWTGAISFNGYPLFFKENHIHTVRGDYPPYNISDNPARGVKDGSEKSLAIINEVLYYHSNDGIIAYQGGLPTKISSAFGNITYKNAIAAGYKNKYYCQMQNEATNAFLIMVFDVAQGLWHKESRVDETAYIIALKDDLLYYLGADKGVASLVGAGGEDETDFGWFVETGIYGLSMPDSKYISRLNIRLSVDVGAWVIVSIEYDSSGEWERLCTVKRMDTHAFTLPIKPRRCDHFRLRLEGNGQTKIYSISKTIEQGSDKVHG